MPILHQVSRYINSHESNFYSLLFAFPDTLKEWSIVLYGTETSPDGDDILNVNSKPGIDVDQVQSNVVDTEGDPWTGSQRIDQPSHPEVQQTTTKDQTSGACTNFDGSRCLGAFSLLILLLLSFARDSRPHLKIADLKAELQTTAIINETKLLLSSESHLRRLRRKNLTTTS